MEPSNEESALLTPLQEVDTHYMSRIVEVLTRKANENANGWTKLGLLANVNEEAGTLLMYKKIHTDRPNRPVVEEALRGL